MNPKLKDPGIILLVVLVAVSAFVLIWWPTDIYLMGISLAGWLMFFTYFIWFLLAIAYVLWIEKVEKEKDIE
jgi:membrane protein implicated in regulation of membrane protease activity